MHPDAGRLSSAYRKAWSARESSGRTDSGLLFEVLESEGGLGAWLAPAGRRLLARKWDAGVPPWRLRWSLLSEIPALTYRATVKPAVAVLRAFRGDDPAA